MSPNQRPGDASVSSSPDDVFRALSHPLGRNVLLTLLDPGLQGGIPIPDGLESPALDQESEMELYHTHLPMLDEMGLVRWEPDSRIVFKGPAYERFRPLLGFIRMHQSHLLNDGQ